MSKTIDIRMCKVCSKYFSLVRHPLIEDCTKCLECWFEGEQL